MMKNPFNNPRVWVCLGLMVATLAVYAQVRRFDFIDLDDGDYVFENWHVISGLSVSNVTWAFTTGHASNWHPLTWLSHMLDMQAFGLRPGSHHMVNVILHIANACLLFLVLMNLTGALWRSAMVAALFAWHPLHVESVAWIAERKDVLSTLFFLLALSAYAWYARNPGIKKYLTSLILFGLGLMAKPMLVTLPFVLLLLDYWPLRRFSWAGAREVGSRKTKNRSPLQSILPLAGEKLPFFLLAAASSVITVVAQTAGGAVKTVVALPLDARISNAVHSYAAYLMHTVWPVNLSVYYRLPVFGYPAWKTALAVAFLIGVTVLVFRFARELPYLLFGWFWFLGTLVPVIGLVQVGGQAMADRYTYIPLIGVFVAVSWGFTDLVQYWAGAGRMILAAVGPMILAACVAVSWVQVSYWHDTVSLFTHAAKIDDESYLVHELLGAGLAKRNQHAEAIAHYSQSLRLLPSNTNAMGNLGYSLYCLGRPDEALEEYARVLKIKPDDPVVLRNLGQVRLDQGRYQEAVDCFRRAQRRLPPDFLLECSLGNALLKLGKTPDAVDAYNTALRLRPTYPQALFGLGMAFAAQGKISDAISMFDAALRSSPGYAEAHTMLGNVLAQKGQVDQALWHYSEALRLNPRYAEAYYNKGVVLHGQGNVREAVVQYREAIRLKPDYVNAIFNLAAALEGTGDFQGALTTYREAIRLKPDFVEAYNNLGVALFNHGQIQQALAVFSDALRVNPNDADARRNRDVALAALGKSKREF